MSVRMSRLKAATTALWLQDGARNTKPQAGYKRPAFAAMVASDALLRDNAAVERVARALEARSENDDWDWCLADAKVAIEALLGE